MIQQNNHNGPQKLQECKKHNTFGFYWTNSPKENITQTFRGLALSIMVKLEQQ